MIQLSTWEQEPAAGLGAGAGSGAAEASDDSGKESGAGADSGSNSTGTNKAQGWGTSMAQGWGTSIAQGWGTSMAQGCWGVESLYSWETQSHQEPRFFSGGWSDGVPQDGDSWGSMGTESGRMLKGLVLADWMRDGGLQGWRSAGLRGVWLVAISLGDCLGAARLDASTMRS